MAIECQKSSIGQSNLLLTLIPNLEIVKPMAISPGSNLETQYPNQIKEIQEIAISIAAKNLNPTMLSEEFLKFSGIIPEEWELAKQPILSPNGSQVTFKNGVSIVAQPRTISFMEGIGNKSLEELKMPNVALQYAEKLPKAEYQNLSINPKCLVPMSDSPDSARNYITQTILSPGPWQNFGNAPLQAGINLLYKLDRCQFSVSINEATIQLPENRSIAALLFAGSFNYPIEGKTPQERLENLKIGIEDWHKDLKAFQEIVSDRFLAQQAPATLFPQS